MQAVHQIVSLSSLSHSPNQARLSSSRPTVPAQTFCMGKQANWFGKIPLISSQLFPLIRGFCPQISDKSETQEHLKQLFIVGPLRCASQYCLIRIGGGSPWSEAKNFHTTCHFSFPYLEMPRIGPAML